jgi:DNA-binding NtrC family response regulator
VAVNRGEAQRPPPQALENPAISAADPFLGTSAVLVDFLARLRRAAASESTVLLCGESGTGKARAARRLHAYSGRSAGPFVAVSLVATSSTLIEGTLFGHERGAFTDARTSRLGLFRRAQGGTVVLEDVEHLPLDVQVKLLRVLQERVVEPLGSESSVPIDVRVVATTSEPLERAVAAGRFREDLFFRLAVLPLEVPPLRARKDDLELLAAGLLESVSARVGVPPRPLSPGALAALAAHAWPGNVRELENAVERVLVLGARTGSRAPIEAEEFAFLAQGLTGAADDLARAALAQGLTLDQITLALLARALQEHRGNVSAAARSVGLTRRAFEYRRTQGNQPESEA